MRVLDRRDAEDDVERVGALPRRATFREGLADEALDVDRERGGVDENERAAVGEREW